MGKISSLKAITISKIEAFLARIERPKDIIPQLVKEMAQKVEQAGLAEAKSLTAVKADRRRLDGAIGKVDRFNKGAKISLQTNDQETARKAIAAQIAAERQVESCKKNLSSSLTCFIPLIITLIIISMNVHNAFFKVIDLTGALVGSLIICSGLKFNL